MKVDGVEMRTMIKETFKPGHEMIEAINLLTELVKENGLMEDPRYKKATHMLVDCMNKFQDMGVERGLEVCRKNAIIDEVNKSLIGRKLIEKAVEKLGD